MANLTQPPKPLPPAILPIPLRANERLSYATGTSYSLWEQYSSFVQLIHQVKDEAYLMPPPFTHNFPFKVEIQDFQPKFDDKSCEVCGETFVSFKGMKQHLGKKHPSASKTNPCKTCSKLFTSKYSLKFHDEQVHQRKTRVSCEVCGKLLYNKYALKKHLKERH
jgi:ribosomal protein S27E